MERSIPAWAGEPAAYYILLEVNRVYPRVGGGTVQPQGAIRLEHGLSPRGRGNQSPRSSRGSCARMGSIPAWAGEPSSPPRLPKPCTVYPRVGGGSNYFCALKQQLEGLSPRGRGNPVRQVYPVSDHRTLTYPRVGGGTSSTGDSPLLLMGLSPRGRGNRGPVNDDRHANRSIPAWAGEPKPLTEVNYDHTVYPRVGGGTEAAGTYNAAGQGLSPRGRGNH